MATTEFLPVVSDAGPLIHLDQLACLDLLQDLGPLLIPREVWAEAVKYRPRLDLGDLPTAQIVDVAAEPSARLLALIVALGLDTGESVALALVESLPARSFLCDDAAARLAAESLGFTVHGTIGILLRSVRVAARTPQQVLAILQDLPRRSSLYVSHRLLETVIREVERSIGRS